MTKRDPFPLQIGQRYPGRSAACRRREPEDRKARRRTLRRWLVKLKREADAIRRRSKVEW